MAEQYKGGQKGGQNQGGQNQGGQNKQGGFGGSTDRGNMGGTTGGKTGGMGGNFNQDRQNKNPNDKDLNK